MATAAMPDRAPLPHLGPCIGNALDLWSAAHPPKMPTAMPSLICPLCHTPLLQERPSWHCQNGHSFDVARESYVNLLPVQHRRSLHPGDEDQALQARRRWLDAGHYAALRTAVIEMMRDTQATSWVDIGCCEGYYTAAMGTLCPDLSGVDIAKTAVRMAAKRYPGITWLVASAARLPWPDASLQGASSLFAPLPEAELRRILRPGAYLIHAAANDRHLYELRSALFDEVRAHEPQRHLTPLLDDFDIEQSLHIEAELTLTPHDLQDLIAMTPYAWAATPERLQALRTCPGLTTRMSVQLSRLRRHNEPIAGEL